MLADLPTLVRITVLPTVQTLVMTLIPTVAASLLGVPLGVWLACCNPAGPTPHRVVYRILDWCVNLLRSFPFIILLILLFPLSRVIVGTTVGTAATLVPLSIAATPLMARLSESAFMEVDPGVVEAALAGGATIGQLVCFVWLRESRAALIRGATLTAVNLVGYSAMAGAVGGGGLGDLAVRWGVHRYRFDVLVAAVVIIIVVVQLLQWLGERSARHFDHR